MQGETNSENDTRAAIYLQPIAAPSILGLYGLAGATFMVSAYMAHWFGTATTPLYLFPFAAIFGGVAQFLAGMWAYKARDGVATAVHGMWGSFWMAFGVLYLMVATGGVPRPLAFSPDLGFWFIVLAAITWVCVFAAAAENRGFVILLALLAAGSTIAAVGELAVIAWLITFSAYLFILASFVAWYTASALMLHEAYGREILSLGRSRQARESRPVSIGMGEPGVIRGQA